MLPLSEYENQGKGAHWTVSSSCSKLLSYKLLWLNNRDIEDIPLIKNTELRGYVYRLIIFLIFLPYLDLST